jgi:hypothetical protein
LTLVMTIVAPWGVWQCSDQRAAWVVRNQRTGELTVIRTDDSSVKHIQFQCRDGAALLAYSGLAKVGTDDISDWLRRLLRGQSRTVDETLIRIREAADTKLARPAAALGLEHAFLVGAFLQGRPWPVGIANTPAMGSPPLDHFETSALRPEQTPTGLAVGGGWEAISDRDWALLRRIVHRRPAKPEDYSRTLARVHRRAKQSGHKASKMISEACITSFMPPSGEGGQTATHWSSGDPFAAKPVPLMASGVDTSELHRVAVEALRAIRAGQPLSDEELQRRTEEAGRRSVEPSP